MNGHVIGLGQPIVGDDGVGHAVIDWLRREGLPQSVTVRTAVDATDLIGCLACTGPVVVVDAVLGAGPAGRVLVLDPERLADGARTVSTHGMSVAQAIALARVLSPPGAGASVRIVAITIESLARGAPGLSAPVAAALPQAVAAVRSLLEDAGGRGRASGQA